MLIGGYLTVIYIYCYIHSFSRYQIFEVSLSQNQASIFEALENSIIAAGGACSRIQSETMQNPSLLMPLRITCSGTPATSTCVPTTASRPPDLYPVIHESKGKVEKSFSYLENHFIAGNSFEDFPDLQNKLKQFEAENAKRIHSLTKAAPSELFEQEKLSLLSLPETRYVGIKEDTRKVSYDCLLSYEGSRYSVPWMFAGKFVWIKVSQGYYLHVFSQANKLIASHKLSLKKGSVVIEQRAFLTRNYGWIIKDLLQQPKNI